MNEKEVLASGYVLIGIKLRYSWRCLLITIAHLLPINNFDTSKYFF